MFKTIKHIKKKILAATMAAAILVSGNISTSSVNSGNHSITGTTATVSAKTIYYCPYCEDDYSSDYYWFFTELAFENHLKKKHDMSLYRCPYCDYKLNDMDAMAAHRQSCKYKNKPHTCDEPCKYRNHGCPLESFANAIRKEKHEEECPYKNKCAYCNTHFVFQSSLETHLTECTKNPYRQLPADKILELENSNFKLPTWNVDIQRWVCPYCSITYTNEQQKDLNMCVQHIEDTHPLDKYIEQLEKELLK